MSLETTFFLKWKKCDLHKLGSSGRVIFEGCPKSLAQLLIKTKKFIFYFITLQCNTPHTKGTARKHSGSPSYPCKSWFSLSRQISQVTAKDRLLKLHKRNHRYGSFCFGNRLSSCGLRSRLYSGWLSTSQLYSWKTVVIDVAVCGWASWRMITQSNIFERVCWTLSLKILHSSIVMENDHTMKHLWMRLLNFRPQNALMLVHCTTIWHHVCGNYTSIIVSHYHYLFHF